MVKVILRIKKIIRMIIKRMSVEQKRLAIVGFATLILGILFGNWIGHALEEKKSNEKVALATAKVQETEKKKLDAVQKELYDLRETIQGTKEELPWNLVLVNFEHPMEKGYVPELVEIEEGHSVDSRIVDATNKMLTDAEKEGLHILIGSAYRSVDTQEKVYSDSMKKRVKKGMSYWDAYKETAINVAEPGTSEHALGLALDLISNQYIELDEKQEETAEAKWLAKNCHKYGFILRYPSDKTNITGITYEPWHYRYVGVETATEIMELGVTLEEYLQNYYVPEEEQ